MQLGNKKRIFGITPSVYTTEELKDETSYWELEMLEKKEKLATTNNLLLVEPENQQLKIEKEKLENSIKEIESKLKNIIKKLNTLSKSQITEGYSSVAMSQTIYDENGQDTGNILITFPLSVYKPIIMKANDSIPTTEEQTNLNKNINRQLFNNITKKN